LLSWEEPQYVNQPGDTVERVDTDKLESVSRVVALTAMTLADD
jgi:hypothetical protein